MTGERRVVYLEDLEKPAAVKENVAVTEKTSSQTSVVETEVKNGKKSSKGTETKSLAGTKRQRSLMDMFSSTPSSTPSPSTSSKVAKTDKPTLNSIPFSLSEYQKNFSEEEKLLLELECETMGRSW